MARPNQEAIETFMSVGIDEAWAFWKLEEHGGDLNAAVNAHFSEGDRSTAHGAFTSPSQDNAMGIEDSIEVSPAPPRRNPASLLSEAAMNPFSLLDPQFRGSLFDSGSNSMNRPSFVSHPREVREMRIEEKDGGDGSSRSGNAPIVENVTETEHAHGPDVHGTVNIDDEDDDDIPTLRTTRTVRRNEPENNVLGDNTFERRVAPIALRFDDLPDYGNDIEEEMIQVAIDASKRDVQALPVPSKTMLGPPSPALNVDEEDRMEGNPLKTRGEESGSVVTEPPKSSVPEMTVASPSHPESLPVPEAPEGGDVPQESTSKPLSDNTYFSSVKISSSTPSDAEIHKSSPVHCPTGAPSEVSTDIIGEEVPPIRSFTDYLRVFKLSPYEFLEKLLDSSCQLPTFFEEFFSDKLEGVLKLARSLCPSLEGELLDSVDLAIRSIHEIRTHSFSCVGKDALYRSAYPRYAKYPPTEKMRFCIVTLDGESRRESHKLETARRREAMLKQLLVETQEEIYTLEAKLDNIIKEKTDLEAEVGRMDEKRNVTDGCAKSRSFAIGPLRDLLGMLKDLPHG